jgi:hypothetical protein
MRKLWVGWVSMLVAGACLAETYVFHVSESPAAFQRDISDVNSQVNQVLRQYESPGVTVVPFQLNGNTARATVTGGGQFYEIIVINDGGANPVSVSAITGNRVVRNVVLSSAVPAPSGDTEGKGAANGPRNGLRTDLFYNPWKAGDIEGDTYGLNASAIFGPRAFEVTLSVPVHATQPKDGNTMIETGGDGALRIPLGSYLAIGGHGSYLVDIDTESQADKKTKSTVVAGPFAALNIPLGDAVVVSAGCLYEMTKLEDADEWMKQIVPAANLGIRLTDHLAVNVYGMHYINTEEGLSDFDYTDVGGDLALGLGVWTVSVGGKTTVGLENFDSTEFHLGSAWLF